MAAGHMVTTLIIVLLTYILDSWKTRQNLLFPAFCEIFDNALFGEEAVGIINLADMAKVLGPMICVGLAVPVTLWKEIALKIWSSPLLLKEGNANTDDNEPVFEILIKNSLLLVAILWGFILQATRLLRGLALQEKGSFSVGLRLRNSRGGVALIVVMFVIITILVASTATAATTATDADVGDKLPSDCQFVLNCGDDCMSCSPTRKGFNCCM